MIKKNLNQKKKASNQEYYDSIMIALNKIKSGEQPKIDHYDFIQRVLHEALLE